MTSIGHNQKGSTRLFWTVLSVLALFVLLTANQPDFGVLAGGLLLAVTALVPLYVWLLGWSHGLPIWPVFSLVTGLNAALPMVQDPVTLSDYTSVEILTGGMTMVGFLLLGTLTWCWATYNSPKAPRQTLMIDQANSVRYLLMFVASGVVFSVNQAAGWIPMPGNSMQVLRGIAGSLSSMGLFVLAFYAARGLLRRNDFILFVVGAVLTIIMGLTALMLAQIVVPVALIIFGYVLGSGKMPWRLLLATLLIAALLHPGKYAMRDEYWGEDARGVTLNDLPSFYSEWIGYGLEEIGGVAGLVSASGNIKRVSASEDERRPSTIFERSGNLHMLLLVQKLSPTVVPFFYGDTYAPIPRLLIPRFLDEAKGISHAGSVMLTVAYGVVSREQISSVSIAWGLVPEAYANFGYLGVGMLAVALALFYAFVTRLGVGVPMTSLRFVAGLLVMSAATTADTMGIFVTTQFQGVIGLSLASFVLMRTQTNPFAEGEFKAWDVVPGSAVRATREVGPKTGDHASGEGGIPDLRPDIAPLLPMFQPAAASPEDTASLRAAIPSETIKRLPRWAPRFQHAELRRRLAAAQLGKENAVPVPPSGHGGTQRARQLSVPFQGNYRRR